MSENKKSKVLVAMSGGVDSAVAALLVKEKGFEAAGITMKLWSDTERVGDTDNCEPDSNILDARSITDSLSIPHYSVAMGESFRKSVIEDFLSQYKCGNTPNPCVVCNRRIKFGTLFDKAKELGYDTLATGHYARIVFDGEKHLLKKAKDESKDQSYFLWSLPRNILPHILFPLGDMTKSEIRDIASKNGFSNAHRKDSQDICFIPDGDYVSFIKRESAFETEEGDFVDTEGKVLGKHSGLINYTIGQRKGLGIALGEPMFVMKKDATKNTVTLCRDAELFGRVVYASSVNLLTVNSFVGEVRLNAKIRYRHTPAPATVSLLGDGRLKVVFDEPQRAISPGQSLVLYDGDTIFGGGIIE